MFADLRASVRYEKRWLYGLHSLTSFAALDDAEASAATVERVHWRPGQVEAVLRIEVAHSLRSSELAGLSMREVREFHQGIQRDEAGPPKFEGVAIYFVDRLPSPGWRVINPMRRP